MAASCTITSQTIGNSAVNLTTKGGQDYFYVNGSGTVITKSGGGSKISIMGYINATHTRDVATSSMGHGGGFANTPVTTSDGTPSNVTGSTSSMYLDGMTEMGFIPRVAMGIGSQVVEINVGAYLNSSGLPLHLKVTSPSAGILVNVDLTGVSANTDTDKVLVLTCVSEASENWDFDVSNKIGEVGSDGFIGVRYVHLGSLSGGGSSYNVTLADSHAITDAVLAAFVFPKALADSHAVTDAYASAAIFPKSLADTMATSDAYAAAGVFLKALADSHAITDSFIGNTAYVVTLADSTATSDTINGVLNTNIYDVALADSHAVTDAISALKITSAVLADSHAISDVFTGLRLIPVQLSDSAALTDALNAVMVISALLQDSITITDIYIGGMLRPVTLADSLAATDSYDAQIYVLIFIAAAAGRVVYAQRLDRIAYANSPMIVVAPKINLEAET
jgi:hypothetical protein